MAANACCRANVPAYSGYRQEGWTWTCPLCQHNWEWIEDEAEGGGWWPVGRGHLPALIDGKVCE